MEYYLKSSIKEYTINKSINNKFEKFTLTIKSYLKHSTNTIHKARNEIKIVNFNNQDLIIKSFKIPNIINKIIYTFLKNSKAKKSYKNSIKIINFVPIPISFIEFSKFGLLQESYFISEHFNYNFTIREPLLRENYPQKKEILKAFAKFTFELHENKILHQDYSPGNILIKKEDNIFIFKIVDINRMQFKPLDLKTRLKNFSKLWAKDEDLAIIIKEYATLIKADEESCLNIAVKYSKQHKKRKNFKKILKGKKIVD
jgi:serine/threonine protein kinase